MRYLLCLCLAMASVAQAEQWFSKNAFPNLLESSGWQNGDFRLRTSIYSVHYDPKPEHNNHQRLISVDYVRTDDWFVGAALFDNSFGQPSQYVYLGKDWWFIDEGDWRLRGSLSAGFLHGYKDEYKDKIPFNNLGVAPAILPALGLTYRQSVFVEVQFFAAAGAMATVGYRF
ncbi:hypothetical protein L0B52_09005 [Suttonella sp. R2A3]|uniref:hypothetical protein n=1 Tax=Suttonella sp. R2A3 TaxID=2908648 RepID=UPI001F42D159|nr:hypothetical protein [Suttonella sp. R2A3]UJF24453.1 hypothetical protein L0B52_09005 [Suttonella sp. R2A3]